MSPFLPRGPIGAVGRGGMGRNIRFAERGSVAAGHAAERRDLGISACRS